MDHNKLEDSSKDGNSIPPYLSPEIPTGVYQHNCVKQQLELEMKQLASSKLGKEYDKAVYCHFDYLIYMHSTHTKCQAG